MNFNTIKIAPVASAASKVESHTTRYFPDRTTIIVQIIFSTVMSVFILAKLVS